MKWNIPTVLSSQEIIDKAFRASSRLRQTAVSKRRDQKNIYIAKIGAASGIIQSKLSTYIRMFPSVNNNEVEVGTDESGVAMFYYELFDLTFGVQRMKKALSSLSWAIKKVRELESEHTKKLRRSQNPQEMEKIKSAFFGRISSVVNRLSHDLEFLAHVREELKKMPDIMEGAMVIVVAGAPNVGKSSLINLISSGNSAIASYPFTTKGILLGHLEVERNRVVMVDTPGLLDRLDRERNPIEKKAVSALKNLARGVIFVLDPSEHCGFSLQMQCSLLEHVKAEIPNIPFLVVENKSDMISRETRNIRLSCKSGEGVSEIIEWLKLILNSEERE